MTHDLQLRNSQLDVQLIKTLPSGSFVKVCAQLDNNQGDPFWVQLTCNGGEEWTGEITTTPVFLQVRLGDRVYLRPENVYDFRYPDDPPVGL